MSQVSDEVKTFMTTALTLPADKQGELLEKLVEYGMTDMPDLEFLEPEKDLSGTLNLLCLRKLAHKLRAYFSDSVPNTPGTPSTLPIQQPGTPQDQHCTPPAGHDKGGPSPLVTPGTSKSKPYSRAAQSWAERFEIPWERLPASVLSHCKKGTRPKKPALLETVRIVCREIAAHDEKPGKANLTSIAKQMVAKYPETFGDIVSSEGQKGHSALSNRFRERFENLNRSSGGNSFRRKLLLKETTEDGEKSGTKRKPASVLQPESYGCIRWQPDLPEGESAESQEEKRLWLLNEFNQDNRDSKQVSEYMAATYCTQRYNINSGSHVAELRSNWPFLFEPGYLLGHFEMLMDFSLLDRMDYNVNAKSGKLFKFMQEAGPTVSAAACQLEMLAQMFGTEEPKTYGTFLLLPVFFKENTEDIFKTVETTITAADLEEDEMPDPHVVIKGNHPFEDNCYAVVEGCVLAHNIGLRMAFGLVFASYYCFNIPYPGTAALTLEFVQRMMADINPTRGSKVKKPEGKRRPAVSTKVKSLCEKLRDFANEWTLE